MKWPSLLPSGLKSAAPTTSDAVSSRLNSFICTPAGEVSPNADAKLPNGKHPASMSPITDFLTIILYKDDMIDLSFEWFTIFLSNLAP
ncbi:hypothetical protein D3C85_1602020 [compost metagenome]